MTEAEINMQDVTPPVKGTEDVAMSLQRQRSASEMTADLGHPAKSLQLYQEK